MGEISFNVPYSAIRDKLAEESEDYVKHIWQDRKNACIMAAGEILEEHGYLPHGTKYEPWGDQLWFSVEKKGAELAHYFHEGLQYGQNFFIKDIGEWRSKRGMPKHVVHPIYTQDFYAPAGVPKWTESFNDSGLYAELCERVGEILRR